MSVRTSSSPPPDDRRATGRAPRPPLVVEPLGGLPEIRPGDDLARMIADAAELADGDVLVVAQKVVSKAEGRLRPVPAAVDAADERRRVARAEARRVVADTPWVLVTETPHGFVCANGGVDASNAPEGTLVLLPVDADDSARRLRAALRAISGRRVAVVIADTFGRPWRLGQTDVAIGAAGLAPVRDERGSTDREGRRLEVTETAVADALAAAGDLVRGKGDGVPVVRIRGFTETLPDDGPGARSLVRPAGEDLFRLGAGMLASELALREPPPVPLPDWVLERLLAVAERAGATAASRGGAPTRIAVEAADDLTAGLAAGLLVAALVDAGGSGRTRPGAAAENARVVVEAGWGR